MSHSLRRSRGGIEFYAEGKAGSVFATVVKAHDGDIFDADGNRIGHLKATVNRPPEPIDPNYDPSDKSNFRSCCDPPTE